MRRTRCVRAWHTFQLQDAQGQHSQPSLNPYLHYQRLRHALQPTSRSAVVAQKAQVSGAPEQDGSSSLLTLGTASAAVRARNGAAGCCCCWLSPDFK